LSNEAYLFGGAIAWIDNPKNTMSLSQINFYDNTASAGGAIYSDLRSAILLKDVVFENNKA
jgi:predicted outer membrane repeat protein